MAAGGEGSKGVEGKELSKRIGQLTSKGLLGGLEKVFLWDFSCGDDIQHNVWIYQTVLILKLIDIM